MNFPNIAICYIHRWRRDLFPQGAREMSPKRVQNAIDNYAKEMLKVSGYKCKQPLKHVHRSSMAYGS